MEVWRTIPGYEGRYEASNEGKIRGINYENHNRPELLNPHLKEQYLQVRLYINGKRKYRCVHRLVAEAFLPNPDNLPQVNHKDENKLNNFVCVCPDGTVDPEKSNLEWCTAEYNCNYGTRNKRISTSKMEKHPRAKVIKMLSIRGEVLMFFKSAAEAARYVGKSCSSPINMVANKCPHCNTAYGYKWEWA